MARELGPKMGKRSIQMRDGLRMEIDLADWIPQDIYLTGYFEPTTTTIVTRLLKPGDTAIDVGANIGYFSLLFAQCVGEKGKVFSYEPVPALAAQCLRNFEINGLSNVKLSNLALSDHLGQARFFVGPRDNSGLSGLRTPRQSSGSFEVQLSSFDKLRDDWGTVTLIKIDVEGAELQVLRGMDNFLRTAQPHLLVEVTDEFLQDMGDSGDALLGYLGRLGYACYVIGDGSISLLDKPIARMPKQWNALFTRGEVFGKKVQIP
jgi:FkbM family methyltransferase